jgi:hypothetical protein
MRLGGTSFSSFRIAIPRKSEGAKPSSDVPRCEPEQRRQPACPHANPNVYWCNLPSRSTHGGGGRLGANLRGNHLRRCVWSRCDAWGRPLLKPGNRFHGAQNGRKPRPGHCGSGAERAQRLGSAALGIIGKAAEHSVQYPPDPDPPSVHREPPRTRNPCTDSEWSLRCIIWLALNARVPLAMPSLAGQAPRDPPHVLQVLRSHLGS